MKIALLHLLAMTAIVRAAPPLPATAVAQHARTEHTHSFTVARPLAEAFVFFEPVGEKNWAEGWAPVFATPADAQLHNGSVFTVERPHGGTTLSSVWTITRYEAPRVIEYHNVLIGVRTTRITVSCESVADGETHVAVRYVYTGLSDTGDKAIAQITDASYREMIDGWGAEIAAFLKRGTPATP
jgi:hypothetical protein